MNFISSIGAKAYCSSANLGAGFDVVGVALDTFFDLVQLDIRRGDAIKIEVDGKGADLNNTASVATKLFLKRIGQSVSVKIALTKGVPTGLGLGSSGASAAAAVYAMNEAFGRPLEAGELIDIAANSEGIAAAGTAHADNVAASLLGGFAFITSINPFRAFSLKPKFEGFYLAIPPRGAIARKTEAARRVLPTRVPLSQSIVEKAALLSMIEAVLSGDDNRLAKAISIDTPVDLARYKANLVPYYHEVKSSLLKEGASGVCISGAGPSLLVYSKLAGFDRVINDVYARFGVQIDIKRVTIAPPASTI